MTDDEADYIKLRAERLRCLVAAIGEEPTMEPMDNDFLPGGYEELLGELDYDGADEDVHLAWECADIARDLRERDWLVFEFITYALSRQRVPVKRVGGVVDRHGVLRLPAEETPDAVKGTPADPESVVTLEAEYVEKLYRALYWYRRPALVPVSEECARYAEAVEPED